MTGSFPITIESEGHEPMNKSISLSIPQESTLHGVRIKKLPIGRYLKAIQTIKNLPELLLKSCFPGQKPDQVLGSLKELNEDTLYQMVGQLIQVAPEQFLRLVAELIEADYDHIVDNLTPKELFEVLKAFWEVNDTTDFFAQIKALFAPKTAEATLTAPNTGSKIFKLLRWK